MGLSVGRKDGEAVVLLLDGEEIAKVTVYGGRVRLLVEAPEDIRVVRDELLRREQDNGK